MSSAPTYLPEKLRDTADFFGLPSMFTGVHPHRLAWIREAADEIEKLRGLLAEAEVFCPRDAAHKNLIGDRISAALNQS